MWPIALISFAFVLGIGTGYKVTHRKIVPLVKFVEKGEREDILVKYGIRLTDTAKCSVCGDNITIENIGASISANDERTFICSKLQCMTVSDILKPISKT